MSTVPVEPVLRSRLASAVAVEVVPWLWPGWVARGTVTVLDGDPGLGKSTITTWLAARVSRGLPLPGEAEDARRDPAGVLLASAEDSAAHTIRPRLEAAGADLDRVRILDDVGEPADDGAEVRNLQLPADLPLIEAQMRADGAALLVLDPLMAYVGRDRRGRLIDAHREPSARQLLAGLKRLAEATGAAVLVVRHLTKSGRASAVHRGTGSLSITAAAWSVLLAGRDPSDPGLTALAMVKGNLGPRPRTLRYRLEAAGAVSRVAWGEVCALRADDLLRSDRPGGGPVQPRGPAEELVWRALESGPRPAVEVYQVGAGAGFSNDQVWRAAKSVGVGKWKAGQRQGWVWQLPTEPDPDELPPL